LYGVISNVVRQRRKEIGIRLALGATRGQVVGLAMRQGLEVVWVGIVAGLAGAWGLTRLLSSLLYGVAPGDPLTLAAGTAVLALAALAACYLPARQAAKADPSEALRHE
jgi:ABC-type antimicrobial peptide transport system permease subunit